MTKATSPQQQMSRLLRGIQIQRVVYKAPNPGTHPDLARHLLSLLEATQLDVQALDAEVQACVDAGTISPLLSLEWRAVARAQPSVRAYGEASVYLDAFEERVREIGGERRARFLAGISRHRAWISFQCRDYVAALQHLVDATMREFSTYNLQLVLCVLVRMQAFEQVQDLMSVVRRETPAAFLEALLDGVRSDPDLVIINA